MPRGSANSETRWRPVPCHPQSASLILSRARSQIADFRYRTPAAVFTGESSAPAVRCRLTIGCHPAPVQLLSNILLDQAVSLSIGNQECPAMVTPHQSNWQGSRETARRQSRGLGFSLIALASKGNAHPGRADKMSMFSTRSKIGSAIARHN